MTENQKVIGVAAGAMVALAVIRTVHTVREQRRLRREIAAKLASDIKAVRDAGEIVAARIAAGRYRRAQDALIDLEFEQIVLSQEW